MVEGLGFRVRNSGLGVSCVETFPRAVTRTQHGSSLGQGKTVSSFVFRVWRAYRHVVRQERRAREATHHQHLQPAIDHRLLERRWRVTGTDCPGNIAFMGERAE
jgi:hypothetical protein